MRREWQLTRFVEESMRPAVFVTLLLLTACSSPPAQPKIDGLPGRPLRPCNAYDYGSPIAGDPCDPDALRRPWLVIDAGDAPWLRMVDAGADAR